MATPIEVAWFDNYADYFNGKPRKMKRIMNSYILARFVANKMRSDSPSDSHNFYRNLMKFTILLEQWPYRMAWMLLIMENIEQEIGIRDIAQIQGNLSSSPIGASLISVFEKFLNGRNDNSDPLSIADCHEIPLFNVYNHVVRVLIHSSDDASVRLQRDGDAQLFEQILMEDGGSVLKVKDITLQASDDTLRPYAFNLQRHTVEKVAVEIENCVLIVKENETGQPGNDQHNWYAAYEKRSSVFDVSPNKRHIIMSKDNVSPQEEDGLDR